MNMLLRGGIALGLVAGGTVVLAGPGSAQEEQLQATIDPATVEQGQPVTLSSVDPCVDPEGVPGVLVIEIFFEDDAEPFQTDEFDLTPEEDPDGQWSIEYTGEPDEEVGTYTYLVTCSSDEDAVIGEYVPLVSEVTASTEPTTPSTAPPVPGPTPPPATPVTREPSFTG